MKTFRCRDAGWYSFVASALLVLLIFSSTSHASGVRQLWQSRDQFVALDRQDSPIGGTVITNDHPVEISPDRLTAILASIEFHSADSDRPEQLITKQSLELIVPEIVQGFRKATAGEDVTFALIGLHSSMLGFGKSPKVTTGRAFYKDGRLNVIFGLVQKDVNEREDRRLAPFTPGSRQKATEGEWTLLPQSGQSGFTLVRKDWVTFSDEWRASVAQIPLDKQNVHSVQTAPVQPGKLNDDTRKPGERLTTLNELKAKGLISEEEYRSKRLEILKGL
jgi:hypothetical protein